METVIKFLRKGVEVERSFFVYDEELRMKLGQIERALKSAYAKTGKWIKGIELNANGEGKFSMSIDGRKELVLMFLEEVGNQGQ